MIIFVIYALVLGFFWVKTLVSTIDTDNDEVVACFLEVKYLKIYRYKQYGLLYIIVLSYLISISMVSARYIPTDLVRPETFSAQMQQSWALMVGFPEWLQGLFFIGLVGLIWMVAFPSIHAYKHHKLMAGSYN